MQTTYILLTTFAKSPVPDNCSSNTLSTPYAK